MKKYLNQINVKHILIFSFIAHLLAAFFSTGFHHFDEHFQIVEFVNFKLGNISASTLPWEYHEKVRPWFQVYIYYSIHQLSSFFGVSSPFTFVFIFRLFSSLFGFFAFYEFRHVLKNWFQDERNYFWASLLFHTAWFVPYIQARTSSENLGISFLLLGLSLFYTTNKRWLFLSGLLLALSYLCRTQIAVMVAGFWFWCLFNKKLKPNEFFQFSIGIAIGILSGIIIDYFGYGSWTFVPWNYVNVNIFLGKMAQIGQHLPFYYFIPATFKQGIPPLSIVLILSTFIFWLKFYRHPLTWLTLPLFLLHSAISHKELRYLYPVIILSPLMLIYVKQQFEMFLSHSHVQKFLVFCFGLNILIYISIIFRPANTAPQFYEYIWKHNEIRELVCIDENPFEMLGLKLAFFTPKDLKVSTALSFKDAEAQFMETKYIFFKKANEAIERLGDPRCEMIYSTYPTWVYQFNYKNWISRSRAWSLFKCDLGKNN